MQAHRFSESDVVFWRNQKTKRDRLFVIQHIQKHGDRFKVVGVESVPKKERKSVGHGQWITLMKGRKYINLFSGAWFTKSQKDKFLK